MADWADTVRRVFAAEFHIIDVEGVVFVDPWNTSRGRGLLLRFFGMRHANLLKAGVA
jgi:hypothetical protein